MKRVAIAIVLLCLTAGWAGAAEPTKQYPLFSLARLHVGVKGEYEWEANDSPTLQQATAKQFRAGLGLTYNLVPSFSGTFRLTTGIGGSPHYAAGVVWEVFSGSEWAKSHPEAAR